MSDRCFGIWCLEWSGFRRLNSTRRRSLREESRKVFLLLQISRLFWGHLERVKVRKQSKRQNVKLVFVCQQEVFRHLVHSRIKASCKSGMASDIFLNCYIYT